MKTFYYLIVLIFLFGCKTKSLTVEKSVEKEKESFSRYFDSLIKQSIKTQSDWQKQQSFISSNLILKSSYEVDSLGNRKPFHYKHFVNGELKEEIWLEGGDIVSETASSEPKESENKSESKKENTRVEVDVGQEKNKVVKLKKKGKQVQVKGFQFGFYLWLLLLIIIIVILRWLAKKFNLFDKLKSIFKEQKKPSDI